jgi:hypothetical protein
MSKSDRNPKNAAEQGEPVCTTEVIQPRNRREGSNGSRRASWLAAGGEGEVVS